MPDPQFRYVPSKADFGLASGGGLAMKVVRFGTFSRYGHAAIVEQVHPSGLVQIIEPMPQGCRRRTANPNEFCWSDVPLTPHQRDLIAAYAAECVGLPYDWLAIAAFLARFWGAKITGRSDDKADRRLICSELVVWAYRRSGVELCPGKAPGAVSPGDLDQWLDDRRRS